MSRPKRRLSFRDVLLGLFLALVAWSGADFLFADRPPERVVFEPTGTVHAIFTLPHTQNASDPWHGRPDRRLAAAIDAAERRVDIAAYAFDLELVAEALLRAHQRGVRIRLVTDSDYEELRGIAIVREGGIPVVTDRQSSLMHNKFIVIDDQTVWTGSWNLTDNGTLRNNNNIVIAESKKLAENFTLEFEEMFIHRQFGITSPDKVPHPIVHIGGTRVETFFEPEGDARGRIIELIEAATSSVHVLAFTLTDDDIAAALIARHRAGLLVRGVIEARNIADRGADFEMLRDAGIDVQADGNPYMMHHKVMILDEAIVVTGSYNFSLSAANVNDENVLILHDPAMAADYMAEFDTIYRQATSAACVGPALTMLID